MRTLFVKWHDSTFHPVDDLGREMLSKIKSGEIVAVEIKRPRSLNHHRLYFALLAKVWDQLDHDKCPTVEELHDFVKLKVGCRRRIETPSGKVYYFPGSIAFSKMGQDEFNDFYNRVCDLIIQHWLPGVTNEQLKREVEIMCGARKWSSNAANG